MADVPTEYKIANDGCDEVAIMLTGIGGGIGGVAEGLLQQIRHHHGAGESTRPDLDQIERDYQVGDDRMIEWKPSWVGLFVDSVKMTETEGALLDNLQTQKGLLGLKTFRDIRDDAFDKSQSIYQGAGAEDGHQDAFRHAYWNALLTREYGVEFAEAFATAHEGVPGNPSDREAMDLYNNEVGRRIALENPDAGPEELARLIEQAIDDGELVVIDGNGDLAWSDQVGLGETGDADGNPANPVLPTPDGDTYPSGST